MKIFRCDRCGKTYYKNADKWDDSLIFRVTWNYKDIDLCDACYVKLQKWVDDEQKESQEVENRYTPEEVGKILITEGQEHGRKYGLKLGDTIRFTPPEVVGILKADRSEENG